MPVSAAVTGLDPNTTYHFRLDALAGGVSFPGADASFTTPPLPSLNSALPPPVALPRDAVASLSLRSLRALSGGRLSLRLRLSGAGRLSLLAKARGGRGQLVRAAGASRRVLKGGVVTYVLRPNAAALQLLGSRRSLPVSLRVAFAPAGGTAARVLHLRVGLRP